MLILFICAEFVLNRELISPASSPREWPLQNCCFRSLKPWLAVSKAQVEPSQTLLPKSSLSGSERGILWRCSVFNHLFYQCHKLPAPLPRGQMESLRCPAVCPSDGFSGLNNLKDNASVPHKRTSRSVICLQAKRQEWRQVQLAGLQEKESNLMGNWNARQISISLDLGLSTLPGGDKCLSRERHSQGKDGHQCAKSYNLPLHQLLDGSQAGAEHPGRELR